MAEQIVHYRIDRDYVLAHEAFDVIEPVFWSSNIYDGTQEYEEGFARFSRPQRLAVAIVWYHSEVNNGGHTQFFTNSTGIVWKDALAGFDAFGLPDFAAVLREAAARVGGDPPLEREPREALFDAFEGDFEDLDKRFYALENELDLLTALTRWIHARPDEFLFEGLVEKP